MTKAASFLNLVNKNKGITISSTPVNWCTKRGYGMNSGTIAS